MRVSRTLDEAIGVIRFMAFLLDRVSEEVYMPLLEFESLFLNQKVREYRQNLEHLEIV